MRIITFTVILTLLVIGFSWSSLKYLEASSEEILRQLEEVEKQVTNEQWQEAQQSLTRIIADWNKTNKHWKYLIDHREIDEIEMTVARLKSACQTREQSDALAELSVLQFYLMHIPAKESLLLRNIF